MLDSTYGRSNVIGHVQNKSMGALGRKCIDQIEVGVRKGGVRPKDLSFDVVKIDLTSVCRKFA